MGIIAGFRQARDTALATLKNISFDNSKNKECFREDLMNIARTTLSSKLLTHEKDFFSKIVVMLYLDSKTLPILNQSKLSKSTEDALRILSLPMDFYWKKKSLWDAQEEKKTLEFLSPILLWITIKSRYMEVK